MSCKLHCSTVIPLEVIVLLEVAEKVTLVEVGSAELSTGIVKKQAGI